MTYTALLIDADVLAYQACITAEVAIKDEDGHWTWYCSDERARLHIEDEIQTLVEKYKADTYCLALTDSEGNFRRSVLPTYKGNRKDYRPPVALKGIKEWMRDELGAYWRPTLEGDDILGILQTRPSLIKGKTKVTKTIIYSLDKDMKTIPGLYARSKEEKTLNISEEEANYWHMFQTLTGDVTDGYAGCSGVGAKTAEKALAAAKENDVPLWDAVVELFVKKGFTEEDALVQARVARILQAEDYNFKTKEPILWNPPKR